MKRALVGLVFFLLSTQATADESAIREAKARLQNIEQLLEDWNVPGARRELTELEKLVPDGVETLHYFQGRVAFEEGQYAKAVELLKKAGVKDSPGSYLRLAQDTLKITQKHQVAESANFIFYYPPGKDEVLAPWALETLESIREALRQDLGFVPEGKVRVEVVNNAKELSKVSTLTHEQIRTTGTIAICKFNKLMVTSPKAVVRGYDWLDTLAHEYVHLVVSQKSHNTVPIWLHEGLAKYLESRWRGAAGLAISPSTLALLGMRVKKNTLIPFEKMHPSIALLPTAEDASTAFAEVFFAIDLLHRQGGAASLARVIEGLRDGLSDKKAVEKTFGQTFSQFESAWLAHVKKQPFPQELIPREKIELAEDKPKKAKEKAKERDISFGDFDEVQEAEARKFAHLGEVLRERNRVKAAAAEYGKAHRLVGNRYESVSNKYALALLELGRLNEAEKVLLGSLTMHPHSPGTEVKLGRIYLRQKDWAKAKKSYLNALAVNPFDPEVHLALLSTYSALNEASMAARARKSAVLLTGLKEENVDDVAKRLWQDDRNLVQADIPVPALKDTKRPDAG